MNNADKLLSYKKLLDSGAITQEEFENKKKELLSSQSESKHKNTDKKVKKKWYKLLIGLLVSAVVLIPIIGWLNSPVARIDILSDVSQETRDNIGIMMAELDGMMSISFILEFSPEPVSTSTQEIVAQGLYDIVSEYKIKNSTQREESRITMQDMFQGGAFTLEDQPKMLASVDILYDEYMNRVTTAQNTINEIIYTGIKENRRLKESEIIKIREATEEIREVIIITLSASVEDQDSIENILSSKKDELETQYLSDMLVALNP